MLIGSATLANPNLPSKFRQYLTGFTEKGIIGEGSQRRWVFINFDDDRAGVFRATPEIGRRINQTRSSDRKENVTRFRRPPRLFGSHQRATFRRTRQRRAANVRRTTASTVFAMSKLSSLAIVFETAKPMNIAVQLDHLLAPGALMKAVDVLSDQQELRSALLHLRQSEMSRDSASISARSVAARRTNPERILDRAETLLQWRVLQACICSRARSGHREKSRGRFRRKCQRR